MTSEAPLVVTADMLDPVDTRVDFEAGMSYFPPITLALIMLNIGMFIWHADAVHRQRGAPGRTRGGGADGNGAGAASLVGVVDGLRFVRAPPREWGATRCAITDTRVSITP